MHYKYDINDFLVKYIEKRNTRFFEVCGINTTNKMGKLINISHMIHVRKLKWMSAKDYLWSQLTILAKLTRKFYQTITQPTNSMVLKERF